MNKRSAWVVLLTMLLFVVLPFSSVYAAKAQKEKFDNFQEVALAMHKCFDQAITDVKNKEDKAAYQQMNKAYFGYYEVQGFEKYVMFSISAARVKEIEAQFRDIKHSLLGNKESDSKQIIESIKSLDEKCARDAMVLDGVAKKDSPNSIGQELLRGNEKKADSTQVKLTSFLTSFGLLLREGLEAILVCIAIVTYLIKSGNKNMCRSVYLGMAAGVLGSFVLAVLVHFVLQGVGQEMVEGWTMFLAVAMLFYVSHWMLHRSEAQAWQKYINSKVESSISKKSQYVLVGVAFLAVIREGAELILFYKASLGGGLTDVTYSIYGFIVAALVLSAIFFIFRFTTVKLPLRPFFLFTSILLFVMCFSFMGKGVQELTEAGVISGATVIPAMHGFSIDWLGVYDRAETMIPQIMILIASAWIVGANVLENKKLKKSSKAKAEKASAKTEEPAKA